MTKHFLIIFLLLSIIPVFAQPKRGLQPEDLYNFKELADANISPDGSRVAYTVTEVSADHLRNVTHIWLVSTNGGEPKRLINDDADETTPRWSPDGKMLAYYSQDALWIINPDGGKSVHLPDGNWVKTPHAEPQKITPVARTNFFFTKAGESFTWSPDSKQIAFLSDPNILPKAMPNMMERLTRPITIDEIMALPPAMRAMILQAQGKSPEDIKRLEAEAKTKPREQVTATDVRVITRLQYKSRTSFSDNLQSHIFIADVTTKQVRQLTSGNYAEHSINWSPKGDEIVFVSNHEPDPDKINNTDLFVANVTTGTGRQLTKTKGCEWQPVFSPDGSQIAYLATTRDVTTIDSVAEDAHAWVISSQDGVGLALNGNHRGRTYSLKWSANGKQVLLIAGEIGATLIYHPTNGNDTGNAATINHDYNSQITSFSSAKNVMTALIYSDAVHPAEVRILLGREGFEGAGSTVPLNQPNGNLLEQIQLSPMREYKFTNENFEIQGWLVPPINLNEKKKYPVILYIHGGPHGMHGYSFNATVQALAAKGYGVLLINPRGSAGYGQKFSDGCVNDWGGGDYRDLMRGVDVALERFPYLDKDRMGVMGGSYGGYMTNWIVTQTDRFKAAIASASLSNLISFYSTSLYQDLVHAEFGGMPWDNYEKLWDRSPLKHIKNVKTPTMLVHGENDNDVHITQAEEMFTALKMRGVDTVLVRYPREGHGIREPKHRVDNLQRNLDWFEKYLK